MCAQMMGNLLAVHGESAFVMLGEMSHLHY